MPRNPVVVVQIVEIATLGNRTAACDFSGHGGGGHWMIVVSPIQLIASMPQGADTLLLELFAIFVWAKIFGELFEHFSLPAVLGEILAGVILGPYAAGLIKPTENIYAFAEIGAIFVLFTAGLETRPQDLIRVGREALRVALAGVIVPFALGFIYMRLRRDATHEAILW